MQPVQVSWRINNMDRKTNFSEHDVSKVTLGWFDVALHVKQSSINFFELSDKNIGHDTLARNNDIIYMHTTHCMSVTKV